MRIVVAIRAYYEKAIPEQRLQLFAGIALQSLLSQTDADFSVLIFAKQRDHARLSLLCSALGDRLLLVDQACSTSASYSAAVDRFVDCRMVRLDTDDALAVDYIERLRESGAHFPGKWTIFSEGYRAFNKRCEPFTNHTNQFLAYDVPNASRQCVYHINHSQVCKLFPRDVFYADRQPAWLYVRHEVTMVSGGRQRTTRPLSELRRFFDVDFGLLERLT